MNRANKARVVFKCEPFAVAPTGDDKPSLVQTASFSRSALQLPPSSRHGETASQTDQGSDGREARNDRAGEELDELAMIDKSWIEMQTQRVANE